MSERDSLAETGGAASGDSTAVTELPAEDVLSDELALPEDVGSEIVLYDHPTVAEVLEDVRAYFAAHAEEGVEPPAEEFIVSRFFDFSYLDRYEELEWKWVHKPFAYIAILHDEEENEHRYHVVEPVLDDFERYVRRDLIELLRNNLMYRDFEENDREAAFRREARTLIDEQAATIEPGTIHKLLYYLIRDFIDFGPIDPIMRDDDIEDVSCDGHDIPVFVYHRRYRDLRTNVRLDADRLDAFTFRLAQRAGKQLTISNPLIDATLPNGSRVQLTLGGDVSTRGSNFTIRKFSDIPFTPVELIDWGTFSIQQMAYFWLAIENNKSLIFAGGTGSGKTSSLNAVSFFVPPSSKVVTIEDTREIDLPHENWIQSITRGAVTAEGQGEVTMYQLLQAALRQRPEYLLVGEIRTEERVALTFFQAMSTGHTSYTTLHADSIETVLSRLGNPPLNVPAQMVQELDVVSVQEQTFINNKRVRRTDSVTEILTDPDDPNAVQTREVFRRDPASDTHEMVADSHLLQDIAAHRGWSDRDLTREFDRRQRVLEYLLDNDITGYGPVSSAIRRYSRDPDALLEAIEAGTLDRAALANGAPDPSTIDPSDLGIENLVERL
ncbi:type II/IV secretion system ATPase subunit [Halapricum hydrolyticum]|uniref:Type II/IV secretion system ATPase subunit n=1 Tax=Halapricum hydrolyticum TaxID=2979991 RepID=A0AAE3IBS6_9EURY|nr:type II/IV secretion system ATPase subunit [Halapricum hydrolyticum]MCU4718265.1 type II/IV secretion system ATPase subunit [Halapricum hydrolyticum]MCU4727287.1 type II/IV secretion system ATPase subunit [Halapricum hydrolyticum]